MTEPQNKCFERIIAYYRERYEVQQPAAIASFGLVAMAEHHSRENKSLLGFSLKTLGPQANEYVFFINEPRLDMEAVKRLESLVIAAEQELVRPGPDHAFTFLSAVALCDSVDEAALKALRKLKNRRNYSPSGWMVARFAAVAEDGSITANVDGSDLKNLLLRVLKE